MRQPQVCRTARIAVFSILITFLSMTPVYGAIVTNPTMDVDALGSALHPSGLSINSVVIRSGVAGQFGTYSNFDILPATIRPGVVLSSGDRDAHPLLERKEDFVSPLALEKSADALRFTLPPHSIVFATARS